MTSDAAAVPTGAVSTLAPVETSTDDEADEDALVVREKTHRARPMTLDQALYEMELVGHDFFLFIETESGKPSVVYRRKGWNYGIISLSDD